MIYPLRPSIFSRTPPLLSLQVPFFGYISAGFPSPAQDYTEEPLDLVKYLVKNPPATFKMLVEGTHMTLAGIYHNDLIIIDRSRKPTHGSVVVAVHEDELLLRRLIKKDNKVQLLEECENGTSIDINRAEDLTIWGVVTFCIHKL